MIWPFGRTNQQVADCLSVLTFLSDDLGDQAAWVTIRTKAEAVLRANPDEVARHILRDGQSARHVVLVLLANLTLRALGSGLHHTYRGRLSQVGASYKAIFSKVVQIQKDSDGISAEEHDQALVNMREAIAEAG